MSESFSIREVLECNEGIVKGGRLGELMGPRETVAVGMFLTGVFELLAPVSAHLGAYVLLVVRFLQGLSSGPMYPSLQSLLSRWVLRSQLSRSIVIIYSGKCLLPGNLGSRLVSF